MNKDALWTPDDDDARLSAALSSLKLTTGLNAQILAALPQPTPAHARAWKAARGLLAASIMEAAAAALLTVIGLASLSEPNWLTEIPRLAGCASALLVGLVLTLGAQRLSRLDCRVLTALTGQAAPVSVEDILIIRSGAVLILSSAIGLQMF